jgi:hypothetical protein
MTLCPSIRRTQAAQFNSKDRGGDVMTIELVFLLIALWILFGIVNAWVLHARGHSGWRWTTVCVASGPLAVSVLYDQIRGAESADEPAGSAEQAAPAALVAESDDEAEHAAENLGEWPRDDPEGPFVLQGYRGLADH